MRHLQRLALVLAGSLLAATWASAAMPPKPPIVVCPRVAQAPTLDGKLDAAEWAGAGELSPFVLLGGTAMPKLQTKVLVMHTDKALYLGAQLLDDKPGELVAKVKERDGKVYEDDSLEVFLDVEGQRQHYAHFVVNPLGTKFDEYDHDVAENFDWNVVASVGEKGWSVEMELAFDKGVAPLAGEVWYMAVCRNAVRANEMSTWARHERSFREPPAFGSLVYCGPPLTARLEDVGDRLVGGNLALVNARDLGEEPATGKLNVAVVGTDRRAGYFGVTRLDLKPQGSEQLQAPYKVQRCGPATVTFSLTDHAGVVAWRTAPYPLELPPISDSMDDIVKTIALSWKLWAAVKDTRAQEALRPDIEGMQKEWRYLDTEMVEAPGMPLARLQAIYVEVQRLKDRAEALCKRVETVAGGAAPAPGPAPAPAPGSGGAAAPATG